ncbi:hypothetical protein PanWU01x14_042990 [Parasponia andersonii]|uniref:Transmembrane protein n=1 Tax=Parasponia andersonii TaxID=3476 RepID=A0A2P5DPV7_PARAD|nr:hypothetical protein PanWU01x14_042990 [Parasponia andersonii]
MTVDPSSWASVSSSSITVTDPNISFWRGTPAGSWPAVTKGVFPPPPTMLLLPLFWMTVLVWALVRPLPLSPVRNGRLLRLLLRKPLMLELVNGVAPLTGKMLLFGLENGTFSTVLATSPVTTRAVGCDPPMMSCMKKDSVGWSFGPVGIGPGPVVADAPVVGPGMGATTAGAGTAGWTGSGDSALLSLGEPPSGIGESASSSASSTGAPTGAVATATAGIWPLGKRAGPVGLGCGRTPIGTGVERGLANPGCGSASSRILAELAHPMMIARNNK